MSPRSALFGLGLTILLTACASPAGKGQAPHPELAQAAEFDTAITGMMDEVGVLPGLGVAIYTPDGIYVRGFGIADVETGEAVTPDTAFYIASSTKSFTALTMAILEARGEIDLDQTLAEFAPDAPFPAEVRPGEVTLRSMLTHTSGLDNGPIGFRAAYSGDHDPATNWALLGRTKVNEDAPLGTYDYTNIGYNILTILTDRKLGITWQELLQREIFDPLGMEETTAYMSVANEPGRSLARPHFGGLEQGAVKLPLEKIDSSMQSAGGLVLSASDAAIWLEFMTTDGMVGKNRIAPADIVASTRAPLAVVDDTNGEYTSDTYGLGWNIGTYKDETIVYHFGGYPGYRAHISYLPEHDIGVAILTNEGPVAFPMPEIVANYVYDRLLFPETAEAELDRRMKAQLERRQKVREGYAADREKRAARTWQLTQPMANYTGTYVNADYGTVVITQEADSLRLTMGNLRAVAEPFPEEDTLRVEMIPFSGRVVAFEVGEDGIPTSFNYDGDAYVRLD